MSNGLPPAPKVRCKSCKDVNAASAKVCKLLWMDRSPSLDAQGRLIFQTDLGYGPLKNRGGAIGIIRVK